jgi:23S rRNA (cytidine2498-2'-O)-methyltransferase
MKTGYLAADGFEEELKQELQGPIEQHGRLLLVPGPPQNVHWAQNIWYEPVQIDFHSISDAARYLRSLHPLWSFYPYRLIRRGCLISERLPYFSPKPRPFPSPLPTLAPGSWMLLSANSLIASARCSSPFANGEVRFLESEIPPGRAYLKLWEILTRIGHWPRAGQKCMDLGACPGSWTWVLQQLGAHVIAIDRAPLDPKIVALPNVSCIKGDAFSTKPEDLIDVDWVFCDVVCFPERLLNWLQKCVPLCSKTHFICTIKFQGTVDRSLIREFENLDGGRCFHLFHNKHELTWFLIRNASAIRPLHAGG